MIYGYEAAEFLVLSLEGTDTMDITDSKADRTEYHNDSGSKSKGVHFGLVVLCDMSVS